MMSVVTLEQIRDMSRSLSADDKLRLIDDLVHQLLKQPAPAQKTSSRSLWGALADLGPVPSAEDIDAMRREAFGILKPRRAGCAGRSNSNLS